MSIFAETPLVTSSIDTASNIGTGCGVFKQKINSDFEFKSFVSGNSSITVTCPDDEIIITFVPDAGGESNTALNVDDGTTGAEGLFFAKVGVVLEFKSIIAGTNVTFDTTNPRELRIDATSLGQINTASNVDDGTTGFEGLFRLKVGNDLEFKSLVPGTNITFDTANPNELRIDGTSLGEANTASNVDNASTGAEGLFVQKTVVDLEFKSLVPGTNVTFFTGNANEIRIDSTDTGEVNTASNLGAGEGVFAQKSGVVFQFKGLVAGTNTTITSNSIDVIINSDGDISGGTNLGSVGFGIFAGKSGNNLEFKRIIGGANVDLISTSTDITIDVPTVGEVNEGINLGGAAEVFLSKSGANLRYRTLLEQDGIIITQLANTLDFTVDIIGLTEETVMDVNNDYIMFWDVSAGGGSGLLRRINADDFPGTGEVNTASNLGGGEGVFSSKSSDDLRFKSLVEGTLITMTSDANEITLNTTAEINLGANLGGGEGIFANKTGATLNFKSIIGGAKITASSSGTEITLDATSADISVVADIAARDALSPLSGDLAYVIDAGNSQWAIYLWTGSAWTQIATEDSSTVDADTLNVIVNFDSASAQTVSTVSNGVRAFMITVDVTTPFDGTPSITIGDGGNNSRLMESTEIDLATSGTYMALPSFQYTAETPIRAYLTGGTSVGSANVVISYV